MIQKNVGRVLERIDQACRRSGRRKEEVELIAVTKKVPVDMILEACRCGIDKIGESKIQESEEKYRILSPSTPLQWHMIGHLQSNKVNRAVEIFDMIQSVDSVKRVKAIDRRAAQLNKVQDCLVEVKLSDETAKTGLSRQDLEDFMKQCRTLPHVRLIGLMTLPPFFDDPEMSRPYFAESRKMFEEHFKDNDAVGKRPILSMGMSHDFEIAIEEGSSMIRIGQAIFGKRN